MSGRFVLVVVVAALLVAWLASAAAAPRRPTRMAPPRGHPPCFLCGEVQPGPMRTHRLWCDARQAHRAPGTRDPAKRGPRAARPGGPQGVPSSLDCPPRGDDP